MIRWFKLFILVAVCVSIGLFCYKTDFYAVGRILKQIGVKALLVFPLTAFAYLLGTLSWRVFLGKQKNKLGLLKLFFIRQIGETISLFNPTSIVGGDLTKIYYLRDVGVDESVAKNSVISSRITMVLSQILLANIAVIWLLANSLRRPWPAALFYTLSILAISFIFVQFGLFYWLNRSKSIPNVAQQLDGRRSFFGDWKIRLKQILNDIKTDFQSDKRAFFLSYILSAFHWIFGSLEFYLILHFLGIDITVMHSILLDMGVILVKSVGAFIPGQIGIEELGNKLVLLSIGISATSIWISVSLLRRFRQLIWTAIALIAYLFLPKQNRSYAFSK